MIKKVFRASAKIVAVMALSPLLLAGWLAAMIGGPVIAGYNLADNTVGWLDGR